MWHRALVCYEQYRTTSLLSMTGRMPGLPGAVARALGLAGLHACLFRVGNILGAGLFKDRLGAVPLRTIVGMHGDEQVPFFDFPLVPLGLIFWHAHANQGARETAQRRPRRRPAEGCHDRASGDEWPQAGNSEGAN